MTEQPMGIALLVCDEIITDARTNKKTLVGIFNQLTTNALPVSVPSMCVFASLTNGAGTIKTEVRCCRLEGDEEIFRISGDLMYPNPNHIQELVLRLNRIVFKDEGVYSFEVKCDDVLIMERRFSVHKKEDK